MTQNLKKPMEEKASPAKLLNIPDERLQILRLC